MEKAIIIGATSGIGRDLALELHSKGYAIGVTGRRTARLKELTQTLGENAMFETMDVTEYKLSREKLHILIDKMGGMDLLVLNAGVGTMKKELEWKNEALTIDVNVKGFVNLALAGFEYFEHQGSGQLAGISSVSALFGYGLAPAYTGSKAFISNYMQGLRQKANRTEANISVTDIRPGFVHTEMTEDNDKMFWTAPSRKAAHQIFYAIKKRKSRAYITKRWNLIACLLKILPNGFIDRL